MDVLQRMPWLAQDAVFQKLASIADVTSLSKKERTAYDENLRKYRDTLAVLEGQFQEGEAKGRAEGEAKGRMAIAKNLVAMGCRSATLSVQPDLVRKKSVNYRVLSKIAI